MPRPEYISMITKVLHLYQKFIAFPTVMESRKVTDLNNYWLEIRRALLRKYRLVD